jgi:hypothetical protein
MNHHSRPATIFGREPAFWIGTIEAALTLLLAFSVLTQDTFGYIFPVVQGLFGLYVAWVTKDTILGALTGLVKAILSGLILFGWTLTDTQTAAILAFVAVVASAYNRDRTWPVAFPPEAPADAIKVADVGVR